MLTFKFYSLNLINIDANKTQYSIDKILESVSIQSGSSYWISPVKWRYIDYNELQYRTC